MNRCDLRRLARLSALIAASALAACGTDAASAPPPPAVEITAPDPDVLELSRESAPTLATVEEVEGVDRVSFNGVVAPDVGRAVQVGSLATGRVLEVRARLGEEVKKGQLLLVAQSPDLAEALANSHKSAAEATLARRALERARTLHERGAIAEKELLQAEEEEVKASVEHRMAAERVRMLGGDPAAFEPRIELRAPLAGTVVEQKIASGDALRSLEGEPLFLIADLSKVWIVGDLHENELARVAAGHPAEARVAGAPGRVWQAKISNVARVLDAETRTAKVRLEVENTDGVLRPGMFASVTASAAAPRRRLAVPAGAVVHINNRDWVFRPEGEGRFRRVAVETGGALEDGRIEILSGLAAGEPVVAAALELIGTGEQ